MLCTNIDLTGTAEDKLREELPEIVFRPRGFWIQACEHFPDAVARNFRLLVDIPNQQTENALNDGFVQHYGDTLLKLLRVSPAKLYLFSNRHDRVYSVAVSLDFKVEDLIHVFRQFFKLPGPKEFEHDGVSLSLSHALVFNGSKQSFGHTLRDCGIADGDIVTYWTTITVRNLDMEARSDTLQRINCLSMYRPPSRENAIKSYEDKIGNAFTVFDRMLNGLSTEESVPKFVPIL